MIDIPVMVDDVEYQFVPQKVVLGCTGCVAQGKPELCSRLPECMILKRGEQLHGVFVKVEVTKDDEA